MENLNSKVAYVERSELEMNGESDVAIVTLDCLNPQEFIEEACPGPRDVGQHVDPGERSLTAADAGRMRRMFVADVALVLVSQCVLFAVLAYVLMLVIGIEATLTLKVVTIAVAVTVGVVTATSLLAVVNHLKRHGDALYREDLAHLRGAHALPGLAAGDR